MTTEQMVAALAKGRTKKKTSLHILWIKENKFYPAGQKGGDVDAILPDGTYRIPDNASGGWFTFWEGVDFVKVKCSSSDLHIETYEVI